MKKESAQIPEEIRRAGNEVVAMYERLLSEGYGEKWAAMCSLQQPPGTRGTDRAVMQGRLAGEWLNQLPRDHADRITREARAAGISTSGRYYCSGLADKRGHRDPDAWIDSAADIKRVAEKRNLTVHGIVEHQRRETPPTPSKPLSERLIRQFVKEESKLNPGKSKAELREIVLDKHTPHWKKKKK